MFAVKGRCAALRLKLKVVDKHIYRIMFLMLLRGINTYVVHCVAVVDKHARHVIGI